MQHVEGCSFFMSIDTNAKGVGVNSLCWAAIMAWSLRACLSHLIMIKGCGIVVVLSIVVIKTKKKQNIYGLILLFHLKYSISSEIIFVVPNMESVIWKINALVWLYYMKKMTKTTKIKGVTKHRGQTPIRTWKGTFHWWRCNCGKVWWQHVALFSL